MDWDNKEEVLVAIKQKPISFIYASDRLKDDYEVAVVAVRNDRDLLKYVSDRLKDDDNFIRPFLQFKDTALAHASARIRNSKEFMLHALKDRYTCIDLKNLSDTLKDDQELVSLLVFRDGRDLQYASKRLRADATTTLIAIKQTEEAFRYVSNTLKFDESYLLKALDTNPDVVSLIPKYMLKNRNIALRAVLLEGRALMWLCEDFRDDLGIVLAACKKDKWAYGMASKRLGKFVFQYLYYNNSCHTPFIEGIKKI